jgi:peptidoglycan/LPS O-acetylase OafA/YrhL
MSTTRLSLVNAAKGVGCLVIVIHHLAVYGPMSEVIGAQYPKLIEALIVYGKLAVQMFFVFGGYFVAAQMAPRTAPIALEVPTLVWKRYKRLITPFLFAVALAALITALVRPWFIHDSLSAAPTFGQLLAHVFFLYDLIGLEALSAGVWYVAIDFQLFALTAIFTALCWRMPTNLQRVYPLIIIALTAFSLWVLNRNDALEAYAPFFFGYYGLGVLAYWTAHTRLGRFGLVLITLLGVVALWLEFRKAVATATITALLLALADLRGRLEHWGDHPALNWLGERSYSIFLIHYGICIGINALWSLWFPTGLWINAVGIVVAVGLSLAAGALLYRLVETRNNALGLNAQTGFLLAAVALTLVLERSI